LRPGYRWDRKVGKDGGEGGARKVEEAKENDGDGEEENGLLERALSSFVKMLIN